MCSISACRDKGDAVDEHYPAGIVLLRPQFVTLFALASVAFGIGFGYLHSWLMHDRYQFVPDGYGLATALRMFASLLPLTLIEMLTGFVACRKDRVVIYQMPSMQFRFLIGSVCAILGVAFFGMIREAPMYLRPDEPYAGGGFALLKFGAYWTWLMLFAAIAYVYAKSKPFAFRRQDFVSIQTIDVSDCEIIARKQMPHLFGCVLLVLSLHGGKSVYCWAYRQTAVKLSRLLPNAQPIRLERLRVTEDDMRSMLAHGVGTVQIDARAMQMRLSS